MRLNFQIELHLNFVRRKFIVLKLNSSNMVFFKGDFASFFELQLSTFAKYSRCNGGALAIDWSKPQNCTADLRHTNQIVREKLSVELCVIDNEVVILNNLRNFRP